MKQIKIRLVFLIIFIFLISFLLLNGTTLASKISINVSKGYKGAWCWFQRPRAIYSDTPEGGKTFFTFAAMDGGSKIGSYNHKTGDVVITNLHTYDSADEHNVPSVWINSSGYVYTFYSQHGGASLYKKISTNPYDISSFGPEQTIVTGRTSITYPNIQYLPSTNELFVFFRGPTDLEEWSYVKSTDGGATFGSQVTFFRNTTGLHEYFITYSNNSRIFFAHSGHPNRENSEIFYMYYENGSFYNSARKEIATESTRLPINEPNMTQIWNYNIEGEKAWIWDIAINNLNQPRIAFASNLSYGVRENGNHKYWRATWNGSDWSYNKIVDSEYGGLYADQLNYSAGFILDKNNPDKVYASVNEDGYPEVKIYETTDGGKTWNRTGEVTNQTGKQNLRPIVTFGNKTFVLWFQGTYNTYTDFDTFVTLSANISTYNVSGHVTDTEGTAIENVHITNDITTDDNYTDSSGYYRLSGLSNDTYEITASKSGYYDDSTTVTISGSNVTGADITLEEKAGKAGISAGFTLNKAPKQTYSISGYVKNLTGTAVNNAHVYNNVTLDDDYTVSTGYYELTGLSNDSYEITTEKGGYLKNSIVVTISGANVTNANITIEETNASVTVEDGRVDFGILQLSSTKSTENLGDTQTVNTTGAEGNQRVEIELDNGTTTGQTNGTTITFVTTEPGNDEMKLSFKGGEVSTYTALNTSYQTYDSNMSEDTTSPLNLELTTPSSLSSADYYDDYQFEVVVRVTLL